MIIKLPTVFLSEGYKDSDKIGLDLDAISDNEKYDIEYSYINIFEITQFNETYSKRVAVTFRNGLGTTIDMNIDEFVEILKPLITIISRIKH